MLGICLKHSPGPRRGRLALTLRARPASSLRTGLCVPGFQKDKLQSPGSASSPNSRAGLTPESFSHSDGATVRPAAWKGLTQPLEPFFPHQAMALPRSQTQDTLSPCGFPEEDQVGFLVLPFCLGSIMQSLVIPLPTVQPRPHEGPKSLAFLGTWQLGGMGLAGGGGEGSPRARIWPCAPVDPEPGFTVIPVSCCRSLIS